MVRLLLLVRVRHVENARAWLPTLLYTPLLRITYKAIVFVNVSVCFVAIHVFSGIICFSNLQKFNKQPEVDIMMPTLVFEAEVIQ